MTNDELIKRLEVATGPDRALEIDIWRQFSPNAKEGFEPLPWLACYTSSIDAALQLVPEGFEWELQRQDDIAFAKLGDPLLYLEGEAKTPAIALCIAALKSRSHQRPDPEGPSQAPSSLKTKEV